MTTNLKPEPDIELEDAANALREPRLELRDVAKTFRTAGTVVHAVKAIDLSIGAGETVALLGPNGAGKSTTIDMLLGLTRPDRGTISLLDRPPAQAVGDGLVAAMLQAGALIRDVTPRELLTLMASLHRNSLGVQETLELTGLSEIADRRTHKLSGGQSQRVRFALALVSDPAVLVLDEPTVGMDVEARRGFWASVREFAARGKTVIFATHLSRRGGRVRRPCRPEGPRPRRGRRPDERDPRPGGLAHDPRDLARRRSRGARLSTRGGFDRPPR